MPLSIACPYCAKILSVPDQAAGKMVRCPSCMQAFPVVHASDATDAPTVSEAVTRTEEKSQIRERSVPVPKKREEPPRQANPFDDNPFALKDDDGMNRPPARPHRAGFVLAMGIISLVSGCFILAFITISMANVDLVEMAAKRMDIEGKGMTQIGKYLAFANIALTMLGLLISCGVFFFFVFLRMQVGR